MAMVEDAPTRGGSDGSIWEGNKGDRQWRSSCMFEGQERYKACTERTFAECVVAGLPMLLVMERNKVLMVLEVLMVVEDEREDVSWEVSWEMEFWRFAWQWRGGWEVGCM
ncbi:hypothetical protein KC19_4G075000 [Ceratodon purpureus]|uniref:Uncharacterized protein n=1 Tax=Ceratodon purpureus TaxID=3225 RepID=A0A8T0I6N8_CERPU|nr:hypothetical protein KC19_4G075000 [Ceratodon purpureus]